MAGLGRKVDRESHDCYKALYAKKNLFRLEQCLSVRFLALALGRSPGQLVLEILSKNRAYGRCQYRALANAFIWIREQAINAVAVEAVPRRGYRKIKQQLTQYVECPFGARELADNWKRGNRDTWFELIYSLVSDAYVALASYVEVYNRKLDRNVQQRERRRGLRRRESGPGLLGEAGDSCGGGSGDYVEDA